MVTNKKPTGRAVSVPAGLAIGTAVSFILTLLAALLMGQLIDKEKLQWEQVGYGIMATLLAASFFGSKVSYTKIRRQRFLICLLSGAAYFGLLLAITALFFGGQYDGVWVTGALILAGSGSAGLLGLGGKKDLSHQKRGGRRR